MPREAREARYSLYNVPDLQVTGSNPGAHDLK